MPGFNAVMKAWHVMSGKDMHIPWPPGSPAPAPAPAPYQTTALMIGMVPGLTSRFCPSVYTDGHAYSMVRGTDIGPMIPHVGPPSATLMVEMLASGSKSHFGASSVQVKDQFGSTGNVACALFFLVNPNLNCGTPAPTPTGLVFAANTHFETLTLGDVLAGAYLMAFDYMAQRVLMAFGEVVADMLKTAAMSIASRFGAGLLSRTVARQMARAMGVRANIGPTARALRAQAAARLAKIGDRAATMVGIPIGLALGSPLGASMSNVRNLAGDSVPPSLYDGLTGEHIGNVEGSADALGRMADSAYNRAYNQYFNSPSAEDVPSSGPVDAGGPTDAGVPGGVPDDGTAGAGDVPDASMAEEPSSPASPGPAEPNMSTAEGPGSVTDPATEGPNMSKLGGDGAPTGSDGTPDAPFSSMSGGAGNDDPEGSP